MSKRKAKASSTEDGEDEQTAIALVNTSWAILEKHLKEIEPSALATLNPGATDAEIMETENKLGRKLPPDLRRYFAVHNGQDFTKMTDLSDAIFSLPGYDGSGGQVALSLAEVTNHREAEMNMEECAEGIVEEDDEGNVIPPPAKEAKNEEVAGSGRGKGTGRGLIEPRKQNMSAYLCFSFTNREEESTGLLLGYVKGRFRYDCITALFILPSCA